MRGLIGTCVLMGLVATALLGGCGDSDTITKGGVKPGGGGSGGGGSGPRWEEIAPPALSVSGGDALNAGGQATAGGNVHMVVAGAISLATGEAPAAVPGTPGDAVQVTDDMLAGDLSVPGSLRIDGDVTSGGAEALRTITAGGDIFVVGVLHAGGAGGARQGLALSAGGGIYVTGGVDAAGKRPGEAGGPISITGKTVIITGLVSSAGADGETDGPAGAAIALTARELFQLGGVVRLRGGAAWANGSGGPAGTLTIDGPGAVRIAGTVDGRGGVVAATGRDGAHAGPAGAVLIGGTTRPSAIDILVPVLALGGNGVALGGAGGTITLEPKTGGLTIASAIDVSGGPSKAQAGPGGTFTATVDGGDIVLSGRIAGNGGGIWEGSVGNGGEAGAVTLDAHSFSGTLTVTADGEVDVDGGRSRGTAAAGGGGHASLFVQNGDLTIAGRVMGRGGVADDTGGMGGLGGQLNIFSDNNHDGLGGNLLLDTTGVLDASGGPGAVGGSARSDGRRGVVASFPDDRELLAVLFNCDGRHGNSDNWLQNLGWIIARGGAHGGNGGDVAYHGITPDRNPKPPSGNMDLAGDGDGVAGDFRGE